MRYLTLLLIFSVALLGAGCERPAVTSTPPIGSGPQIPEDSLVPADAYTLTDLAEHNTPEDCWLAIDGTVYDITEFPVSHTGGAEAINMWCGQDASNGFATKNDSGDSHSAKSKLSLDQFFKGSLTE
jgi:cytochrome b involved in lipid metabolism